MVRHAGNRDVEDQFCLSLGELLIEWNSLEGYLRALLIDAVHARGQGADILAAHLGNVSLTDALQAASEMWKEPMRGHLVRCARLFDAARPHRNYYVHGPRWLVSEEDGTLVGLVQQTSARRALKMHTGSIKQADLDTFRRHVQQVTAFMGLVLAWIRGFREIPTEWHDAPAPLPALQVERETLILANVGDGSAAALLEPRVASSIVSSSPRG